MHALKTSRAESRYQQYRPCATSIQWTSSKRTRPMTGLMRLPSPAGMAPPQQPGSPIVLSTGQSRLLLRDGSQPPPSVATTASAQQLGGSSGPRPSYGPAPSVPRPTTSGFTAAQRLRSVRGLQQHPPSHVQVASAHRPARRGWLRSTGRRVTTVLQPSSIEVQAYREDIRSCTSFLQAETSRRVYWADRTHAVLPARDAVATDGHRASTALEALVRHIVLLE